MNTTPDSVPAPRKPRISYFFATACGLGYLKPGPGTWGSLMGVGLTWLLRWGDANIKLAPPVVGGSWNSPVRGRVFLYDQIILSAFVMIVGVWVSHRAAQHMQQKDPQIIVVDEVSGQCITYLGLWTMVSAAGDWKYFLLGFILFRVFDIWKPFPARQAESLEGGWGIMADDWIAGIYAGLVLWAVQATGILK